MNGLFVFLSLFVGHLLADFPLQVDALYRLRQKRWYGLVLHAGIHVGVASLLVHGLWQRWGLLVLLGGLHGGIDAAKPRLPFVRRSHHRFLADQALHLSSLGVLAYLARNLRPTLSAPFLYVMVVVALIPAALMFISVLKQEDISLQDFLYPEVEGPETPTLYYLAGWIPVLLVVLSQVHWIG